MLRAHSIMPAALLTSLLLGAAEAKGQDCVNTPVLSLVAAQADPSSATTRVPWPTAPTNPVNLQITISQEGSGLVLGSTAGMPGQAVTPMFVAAGDGGASIDLAMNPLNTPLSGIKRIVATWQDGQNPKSHCARISLRTGQPGELSVRWVVNGVEHAALQADGTYNGASPIALRVTGRGLWADNQVELEERIRTAIVPQIPQLAATADGMTSATYRLTFATGAAPIRIEGSRYAASLKSEGWGGPGAPGSVQLPALEIRGDRPAFLPNPEEGGRYVIPRTASAVTVTLRGRNLGHAADPRTITITAYDANNQVLIQMPPIGDVLSACASGGSQCLTLAFRRPAANAVKYSVHVENLFGQGTSPDAEIESVEGRFELEKIESDFADRTVVFAGREATLRIPVPASHAGKTPDRIELDGVPVAGATPTLDGTGRLTVKLTIPTLADDLDRAQRRLRLVYSDASGSGTITIMREPELTQPVVIYGGTRTQTVRIPGRFLSDVTLAPGAVVTPTEVATETGALRVTLSSRQRAATIDQVPVYRLAQRLVTPLRVQVVERPTLATAAQLGVTRSPVCGAAQAQPFTTRVRVPPGGSLCVYIAQDPQVGPDIRDSILIRVKQEEKTIGAALPVVYRARDGVPGVVVPVTEADEGAELEVSVERDDGNIVGTAGTLMRQRLGIYASISAFTVRPGRYEAADEQFYTAPTDIGAVFGLWVRPLPTNRHLTVFGGLQQLTRRFCTKAATTSSVQELGGVFGVATRFISVGVGVPLESSKVPASCDPPAQGQQPVMVEDKRTRPYLFIGTPTLKLF